MKLRVKLPNISDAALFCAKCNEFKEDIDYIYGRYIVDGKSLMGILSVSLERVCDVEIYTDNIQII